VRRRALAYAVVALLAPIPALALDSDEGQAAIEVGAALDSCGLVKQRVVCQLGVSYSPVEGATTYEVSVVGPDGSTVTKSAGAGGTTVFVPYAGSGTYSIQVVAYGTDPDDEERREELSRGDAGVVRGGAPEQDSSSADLDASGDAEAAAPPTGSEQPAEPSEPPTEEPEQPEEPEPPCDEEAVEDGTGSEEPPPADGAEAEPCVPAPSAP
jgi:hypothetical protein